MKVVTIECQKCLFSIDWHMASPTLCTKAIGQCLERTSVVLWGMNMHNCTEKSFIPVVEEPAYPACACGKLGPHCNIKCPRHLCVDHND